MKNHTACELLLRNLLLPKHKVIAIVFVSACTAFLSPRLAVVNSTIDLLSHLVNFLTLLSALDKRLIGYFDLCFLFRPCDFGLPDTLFQMNFGSLN